MTMDTSSTTFCRFSPLKTPKARKNDMTKFDLQDKDVSDSESLISVLTSDIHTLAKSVTSKLKKSADMGMMSSDDDLFFSQSKRVSSPIKYAEKSGFSKNKLSSTTKDYSSESEVETNKSLTLKKQKTASAKKRNRCESEESQPEKKLKSNITSSQEFGRKQSNHDVSNSSDLSSDISDSLTYSSKSRRGSSNSNSSRSSTEGRNGESDIGSDADTSRTSACYISGNEIQLKEKTTHSKSVISSLFKDGHLRYEVPDSFEKSTYLKYLNKSDIQGKQLWLITVPDDFDISTLHRHKIKLTGSSIITDENLQTEKQFSVVGRPFTRNMSSYCSASSHEPGSEDFVLGSQLGGQLQIMDWIPCIPNVELKIPHNEIHQVPDNLKPTFVPFGSVSPFRDSDVDYLVGQKREKKKKRKKDKKK